MVEYSNTGRVFGKAVGRMADKKVVSRSYERNLTPEQKAENDRRTQAAYDKWIEERRERLARFNPPPTSELQHRHIVL